MKKTVKFVVCLLLVSIICASLFAAMPDLNGLTREKAAEELVSYFSLEDESILYYGDLDSVSDVSSISKAVRAGLLGGDGNFRPGDVISEDEIAYIASKAGNDGDSVVKGNTTYSSDVAFSDTVFGGNVVLTPDVRTAEFTNANILGNLYADGEITLSFSGKARVVETREKAVVSVSEGSEIEYLYVWGDDSAVTVDGNVGTVVITGENVSLAGSGVIGLLRANGDGLVSDLSASRITVGDAVSKNGMPLISSNVYDPSLSGPQTSPDADKIKAMAKAEPIYKEIPYGEGITYHDGPVEVSHPFSSAYCSGGHINLDAYGYVEKEFLMYGEANAYNLYENDVPYIVKENVPYCTRVLVRYPDPSVRTPSGNVVVEILNASSAVDLEDMWRRAWDLFLENGDVYIGITSQSGAAEALRTFDPVRYADISWSGEDGLFFDMLSQLGNTIRTNPTALIPSSIPVECLLLIGQSWSGDYVNTYTSVFYDYYNADGSLFDGYLCIVNPAETFIATGVAGPVRSFRATDEPYISIMSQGEHYFESYGDWYRDFEYVRIPDHTEDGWNTRFYEVAGAGHSDPVSPVIPSSAEIKKANGAGRDAKVYNSPELPSDLQMDMVIRGAYENIVKWIREGIPAPSAEDKWLLYRTVVDPSFGDMPECITDENGNALGGIRMPQIEAPVATYKPFRNDSSTTDGSMIYFSKDKIWDLYPNGYADYMSKYGSAASALVSEGYISTADYAILMRDERNINLFY